MAYIYILKSLRNDKFYIGSTSQSVEERIKRHNSGHIYSTNRLKPLEIVFKQHFDDIAIAQKYERRLKRFKRHDFIEKIVRDGVIKPS